jgi:hypothetical protein
MAASVDREASRMLRASEGLARAAVARLECAGRLVPEKKEKKLEKDEKKLVNSKKKERSGKGKGKGKDTHDELMEVSLPGSPSVAAVTPLRAEAAAFVRMIEPAELDDAWADGGVPFGPANRPPRALVARRSGSRSPRPVAHADPVISSLMAGQYAAIKNLVKRPELERQFVRLIEYDSVACRWICALCTGERLRITPEKLQGINAAAQNDAKQQFDTAVL